MKVTSVKMMNTNPKEIEMLQMTSLCIAATQVRTYIEVNCVEVAGTVPKQYVFDREATEIKDSEMTAHHLKAVKQYKDWIKALTTTMTREGAIAAFGYWPVVSDDRKSVSFQPSIPKGERQ